MTFDNIAVVGAVVILIAIGVHALYIAGRRERDASCPGVGITDGVDNLVGLITGTLDDPARVAMVLGHVEGCRECADKLRVIVLLRCGTIEGDFVFTPDNLAAMRSRQPTEVM